MSEPTVFNWVKARHECCLDNVFVLLTEVVDSDVKAIREKVRDKTFTLTKLSANKFAVSKTWDPDGIPQGENVVFELGRSEITVKRGRTDEQLFSAKPALLKNGECKLRVTGEAEPLELWQVSQKALEELFFG